MNLVKLPGWNPHNVHGVALHGVDDLVLYVVPSRGLDVLDARLAGRAAMWVHPSGHVDRPVGDLDHIEGFFTAGCENVGPPVMGLPLHGSFAWRAADELIAGADDRGQFVEGIVRGTDMVRGPYLNIRRRVTALRDVCGFCVDDELTATIDSQFMWLYHPNFIVADGTRWLAKPQQIIARDAISDLDLPRWEVFDRCGRGIAKLPPTGDVDENFERCFAVRVATDDDGGVTSMLVAADGGSGVSIRYAGDFDSHQSPLHLWKNPRGGVCGIERGNTVMGRQWAADHDLVSLLRVDRPRRYHVEIRFARSADQVRAIVDRYRLGSTQPELIASGDAAMVQFYRAPAATA